MKLRRSAAILCGAAVLLAGCGSDELPSKAEFLSETKKQMAEQVTQFESLGMSKEEAETVLEDYMGCVYDSIKDDEELLRSVSENSNESEFSAAMEKSSAACTEKLTEAATDAATASAGG